LGNDYRLTGKLTGWIRAEINKILDTEKPDLLISGMALGVDTLFALIGIERKINVLAAIPCDNQECRWPEESQQVYYDILDNPLVESKIICPGPYWPWKMHKRDEWVVDNSDKLISVWDGTSGGTAHTTKYAKKVGRETKRINPNDYQML
jgi:uncharacterized phage-like protein YoqJ